MIRDGWRPGRRQPALQSDSPEGIEHQKIAVAAQNKISAAAYGELKELVVRRIPTDDNRLSDRHQLGRDQQLCQPLSGRRRN